MSNKEQDTREDVEKFFVIPCRRCDGEGSIYTDTTTWDGPSERADPCPVCKGDGGELIEESTDGE